MLTQGHINFFNINKCGLYKHSSESPVKCEANEAFSLIQKWVNSVHFENTLPWDEKKNKEKMYCHEIYKDDENGDFLLTLWKSDSDASGKTIGIVPGEKEILSRKDDHKGKPVIWGKPCYYWIIPSLNCVASLKFDHSRCDSALFQDWISNAVNNRIEIPGATKRTTENGYVQITIEDEAQDDPRTAPKLHFRFDVSMKSLSTSDARLNELAQRVTHIVKREQITLSTMDERAEWLKLFDRFGVPYASPKEKKQLRNLEIRVEAKPTTAEIKEIIETSAKELDPTKRDFTNIGFVTDTGICWADKYRLTEYISLDDQGQPVLAAAELYKVIKWKRSTMLSPIVRDLEKPNQTSVA